MSSDSFTLAELARYLQRDARELEKLAGQGKLPGRRIGGEWRFHRQEVNHWIERELAGYSDKQLESVEIGAGGSDATGELGPVVATLMNPATTEVPLEARTAPAVLQRLVQVANRTYLIYAEDEVLAAVRAREQLHTTALPGGVAIPHPRRPMPDAMAESLIAFGRTTSGIPFGPRGQMTDVFFLVLCRDDRTHLQVLARLSRMLQREGFLDRLRAAETASATLEAICETEAEVVG